MRSTVFSARSLPAVPVHQRSGSIQLVRQAAFFAVVLAGTIGALPAQQAVTGNGAATNDSGACARLNSLKLPDVGSITAGRVAEGYVDAPQGKRIVGLPPFCRVRLMATPSAQSKIQIELWLPESGWNGRFLGKGNGGGAGHIAFAPLGPALKRGFAVANTDLGTSPTANDAVGFPDKWVDYGYRATHAMTVLSKELIRAYYGRSAQKAYFAGCSTGGQQALTEAQRYPEDYNGIIAGAPARNKTHLHAEAIWDYQAMHRVEGKSFLQREQIEQLNAAVLAACAGKDGGAPSDKFLTDPRVCKFDPDTLPKCSKSRISGCFNPEQITAIKAIYLSGPVNPRTGEQIHAPYPFGAEGGLAQKENTQRYTRERMYLFLWAFGAGFNPMRFDFEKDMDQLDQRLAGVLNANNPDLTTFQQAGGKLIMYTGTADPTVPYPDAIGYYERVVAFEGSHMPSAAADPLDATQGFFRYYLVPGMGHCKGGPGLTSFGQEVEASDNDLLHDLELWVEQDKAPQAIPATRLKDTDTGNDERIERNLCPYPELPVYTGGNPAERGSFQCQPHARGNVVLPSERYLH